jgi:hypothetical protein
MQLDASACCSALLSFTYTCAQQQLLLLPTTTAHDLQAAAEAEA